MRGSSPFLKGVSTGSLCRRQESRFHIFIPNARERPKVRRGGDLLLFLLPPLQQLTSVT
jgi:hypothetical protein